VTELRKKLVLNLSYESLIWPALRVLNTLAISLSTTMVFWQAVATFDLRVRVPRSSDQLTGAVGNANSFAFSFKREQLIKYFTACRFQMYFNFIFLHLLEPILRVGSSIRQSVSQSVSQSPSPIELRQPLKSAGFS